MELGRGLARDDLVDALKRHGKSNFVPLIFLAKSLHDMIEGGAAESAQPRITINLPGAARLEEYRPPQLTQTVDAVDITAEPEPLPDE